MRRAPYSGARRSARPFDLLGRWSVEHRAISRRAELLGLAEVGFCEHVDFDPRDMAMTTLIRGTTIGRWPMPGRHPGVRLRQGVEITYQSRPEESGAWLAGHPWDYVVASVHLVDYADGWAIISEPGPMEPISPPTATARPTAPILRNCCGLPGAALGTCWATSTWSSAMGSHYGPFDPAVFEDEIRAVLRAAARRRGAGDQHLRPAPVACRALSGAAGAALVS